MNKVVISPPFFPKPRGYADGILCEGRTLHVSGQIGWDKDARIVSPDFATQFLQSLDNVIAVVREAGGATEHIVKLLAFVTDLDQYRAAQRTLGDGWRSRMGEILSGDEPGEGRRAPRAGSARGDRGGGDAPRPAARRGKQDPWDEALALVLRSDDVSRAGARPARGGARGTGSAPSTSETSRPRFRSWASSASSGSPFPRLGGEGRSVRRRLHRFPWTSGRSASRAKRSRVRIPAGGQRLRGARPGGARALRVEAEGLRAPSPQEGGERRHDPRLRLDRAGGRERRGGHEGDGPPRGGRPGSWTERRSSSRTPGSRTTSSSSRARCRATRADRDPSTSERPPSRRRGPSEPSAPFSSTPARLRARLDPHRDQHRSPVVPPGHAKLPGPRERAHRRSGRRLFPSRSARSRSSGRPCGRCRRRHGAPRRSRTRPRA